MRSRGNAMARAAAVARITAIAAVAVVVVSLTVGSVRSAPQHGPTPQLTAPPGADPFCAVSLAIRPYDIHAHVERAFSNHLTVTEFAKGRRVGAILDLLTDTDEYRVDVPSLALRNGESQTFLVVMPRDMIVRYAYVDAYDLDGGPQTHCLPEPVAVAPDPADRSGPETLPTKAGRAFILAATPKRKLAAITCGKAYKDATVRDSIAPLGPPPGTVKKTSADVLVYIDGSGKAVKAIVLRSSGSAIGDEQARSSALETTYAPARLRCSGVGGSYVFIVDYEP